jgi:hypothetical protein
MVSVILSPLPFRGGAGGGDVDAMHILTIPTPTPPLKRRGYK